MKNDDLVQIQLTFHGAVVEEVRSDALTAPLLIGRDPSAAWRAPEGDRTMSARAAVLQRHGGRPFLKAEPDASFRLNAVVTRERTLQVGDRIAIGDCELRVTAAKIRRTYAPYHRLEPLVSERRGVFIDLKKDVFVVGSGGDADLRLTDDTVSRCHATLVMHGDECWVHDDSSRNGTFVNAQRLGGKERLLRDGDIIGFGPFEYRFLDRAVPHVRTSPAKNVLVVMATLLIAGGGWWLVYHSTPDATQYMLDAGRLAYDERFEEAEQMLQEAGRARSATANASLLRKQRELYATWRTTASVWDDFRNKLQQRRFNAAADQIGQLALDIPDNWRWNEDTLDARLSEAREAVAFVRIATTFWRAHNDADFSDEELAALSDERLKLAVDRPDFVNDDREWMRSLKQYLRSRAAGFDENEAQLVMLTNETARLVRGETVPKSVRAVAAKVAGVAAGRVRAAAHKMLEPLDKLEADRLQIESDAHALMTCDIAAYSGRPLVTTPDDCTFSPDLLGCQKQNVDRRRELALASLEIRSMVKRLAACGVVSTSTPPALAAFEDTNRVERALRCELLGARRPPRLDRTRPVDDAYDRLFGYEFLYSYIEEGYFAYPQEVNAERLSLAGFHPELFTLNALNEEILADLKLLEGKEFESLRTGVFAERIALLKDWSRRIWAVRDRFRAIVADYGQDFSRRGILARGAALYLTPHDEISKDDWEDFRRRVVWLRENVRSRVDQFDPTQPEKTREVVDWIMSKGIPGSPAVKKAWGHRQ